jgi:uncharacterized membrane protein
MKSKKTRKLILAALFAAICFVATVIIRIPTPSKGYINLGDTVVLIAGWFLGPAYGLAAAGIGSAMADLSGGYFAYVPATFIIKAAMAFTAYFANRTFSKLLPSFVARVVSAVISEVIMVLGYMIFEMVIYRSIAAGIVGVPSNMVQGIAGIVGSVVLYEAIIKRIPRLKKS